MILIENYIKLSREDRRKHLNLSEKCIERGGISGDFKGLLAAHLNTSIPFKMKGKICLCHACNNSSCSNPNHLYWGTYSDNMIDYMNSGGESVYKRSIAKNGIAPFKGKVPTPEHRNKIAIKATGRKHSTKTKIKIANSLRKP